ncbi:YfhO family protein, partial [Lactobacillus nasalidis]
TQLTLSLEKKSRVWAYLKSSFFGSCLAAVSLWPTFLELLAGKTDADISWKLNFQFPPYQLIAKLIDGAYSFNEMSDGLPNIFISSCFALLALLFIFNPRFSKREKLSKGLLLSFLLLSLSFTPLVLLWHLGQFPVWYPARFSFLVSFYALDLALDNLTRQQAFNLKQKLLAAVLGAGVSLYLAINPDKLEFVQQQGQISTGLFILAALLFIVFIYGHHYLASHYALLLVVSEVTVNLIFSLNAISYQENSNYSKFAVNVNQATSYLAKTDPTLYRTEKSFSRSDDDPFTGNYYGITTFNSISNSSTSKLLSSLGYVHNSNSYTNQGGTLLTDAFLGIKYYLEPNYSYDNVSAASRMPYDNLNHRADLNSYYPSKQFPQLSVLTNRQALPLVFASQSQQTKVKFAANNPVLNQQRLWQSLGLSGKLFSQVKSAVKLTNLKVSQTNPLVFKKINTAKAATVTFSFTPQDNDSYYLQLPNGFNFKSASLSVNDIFFDYESRDDQIRLVNVASQRKKTIVKVTFTLTNSTLDLTGLRFWHFDNSLFKAGIKRLKRPSLKLSQSGLKIKSQSFKSQKRLWITTIPYSKNWLVFDNGKLVKSSKYAQSLLAFQLGSGKHRLTLVYLPVSLLVGSLISLLTLAVYLILKKKQLV